MCGRYFLTTPGEVLAELFETPAPPEEVALAIRPRFNIAPSQEVPIVRATATGTRELSLVRWGLVPHWAKDPAIGNRLINARSESVAGKPSFRDSFRKRRCLVPADGYFEWQNVGGAKQPWAFRLKSAEPMALAGIWSAWNDPQGGGLLESCAILTTAPNELAATVHDRMPVILPAARRGDWLDAATPGEALAGFLAALPATEMLAYPVGRKVGNPRNDSPELIEPLPG
ncbi:MAG: SOS response-associated peptidase [Thermoanaerobaculia bacterium]